MTRGQQWGRRGTMRTCYRSSRPSRPRQIVGFISELVISRVLRSWQRVYFESILCASCLSAEGERIEEISEMQAARAAGDCQQEVQALRVAANIASWFWGFLRRAVLRRLCSFPPRDNRFGCSYQSCESCDSRDPDPHPVS